MDAPPGQVIVGREHEILRAVERAAPAQRKRRVSNAKAKSFESEVRIGLSLRPVSLTIRMVDKLNVDKDGKLIRAKGTQSPPDLLHMSSCMDLFVECKLVTVEPGKEHLANIMFNRLKPHQREYLEQMSKIGTRHFGFVAVAFYNRISGNKRLYRAWLLRIEDWLEYQRVVGRESLTMRELQDSAPHWEMEWVPKRGDIKAHWSADSILDAMKGRLC